MKFLFRQNQTSSFEVLMIKFGSSASYDPRAKVLKWGTVHQNLLSAFFMREEARDGRNSVVCFWNVRMIWLRPLSSRQCFSVTLAAKREGPDSLTQYLPPRSAQLPFPAFPVSLFPNCPGFLITVT